MGTVKKIPEIKFYSASSRQHHEAVSVTMRESGYEPWACTWHKDGTIEIVYKRVPNVDKSKYESFVE